MRKNLITGVLLQLPLVRGDHGLVEGIQFAFTRNKE